MGENATLLAPRFERYIQAVLLHCSYRLEPVRAELAAGGAEAADMNRDGVALTGGRRFMRWKPAASVVAAHGP